MKNVLVVLKDSKKVAEVNKKLLCIDVELMNNIAAKSSVINKRYVCPQVTDKNKIYEIGISIIGIKHILVSLGFDVFKVEDVIDIYDKSNAIYVKKENGKNSTFINKIGMLEVIENILDMLDPNRKITRDELVLAMVYQMCEDKVDYINNKIDKEVKVITEKDECLNIINKYNIYDDKLYGNQQLNIMREICNRFKINMSFTRCLKEFGIDYRWVGKAPYHMSHGEEWGVCQISS